MARKPTASMARKLFDSGIVRGVLLGIVICVVHAKLGIFIQENSSIPCLCKKLDSISMEGIKDTEECRVVSPSLEAPLIATHLFAFVLLPVSISVCHLGAAELERLGAKSPLLVVLGLAFILVSIAGEVGWHVGQRWFYIAEYNVLNHFHYVFITLGTSIWALGVDKKSTPLVIIDALLLLCSPVASATYAWAAYASNNVGLPLATKLPIHFILSFQYAVLSWRLFKLFNKDWKVWLFPFFSVGVNMFFIYLLNNCEDSSLTLEVCNPLYHMLHDALGTLLGILTITVIIWNKTSVPKRID